MVFLYTVPRGIIAVFCGYLFFYIAGKKIILKNLLSKCAFINNQQMIFIL